MSSNFKAIFFDLGNVLVDFDHMRAVNKIIGYADLEKDQIYKLIFDSKIVSLFEEGKMSAGDFHKRLNNVFGIQLSYEDFLSLWNEIFFISKRNKFVQDSIHRLKDHYNIFLISNVNILHFEYIKKEFNLFTYFDGLVLSYEVGARKPSPVIYEKALSLARCKPKEAVYFDDCKDLIEAACRLGINGFQFSTIPLYEKNLQDQNII